MTNPKKITTIVHVGEPRLTAYTYLENGRVHYRLEQQERLAIKEAYLGPKAFYVALCGRAAIAGGFIALLTLSLASGILAAFLMTIIFIRHNGWIAK
jgi:hypothetical protein